MWLVIDWLICGKFKFLRNHDKLLAIEFEECSMNHFPRLKNANAQPSEIADKFAVVPLPRSLEIGLKWLNIWLQSPSRLFHPLSAEKWYMALHVSTSSPCLFFGANNANFKMYEFDAMFSLVPRGYHFENNITFVLKAKVRAISKKTFFCCLFLNARDWREPRKDQACSARRMNNRKLQKNCDQREKFSLR